jgi:hypothetical protein
MTMINNTLTFEIMELTRKIQQENKQKILTLKRSNNNKRSSLRPLKNPAQMKFYKNKFTFEKDMSDEEKEIIQENINKRNEKARMRYKSNKDGKADKQRERAKQRYSSFKKELSILRSG